MFSNRGKVIYLLSLSPIFSLTHLSFRRLLLDQLFWHINIFCGQVVSARDTEIWVMVGQVTMKLNQ